MLLFFRVLQGAGGGALVTGEQAMLADTLPGPYFIMAFAVYSLAAIVAPAIGSHLGGWITDNFSWRWTFLINAAFGVFSLLLACWLVQDPPSGVSSGKRGRPGGIRARRIGFALTAAVFVFRLLQFSGLPPP